MAVHKKRPTIRFAFKVWRLALFITNIYAEQVLHKVDSKRQVEGMHFHLLPVSSGSVSRRVGGGDLHFSLYWAGGGTLQNSRLYPEPPLQPSTFCCSQDLRSYSRSELGPLPPVEKLHHAQK